MAFEGDLTNLGLADIFQTLGMNRQSGTLVVKQGDTERRFYFTDEGVSLLTTRSARKFKLGNLLVGMGKLSEGDLKVAVLKQERAKDTKLGDILMQTGLVKNEDIKEACKYQAAEEIYDSFNWKSGKFQFLEGANAGPAGGPGPFAEFFFSVTDIVMEAARRSDEYNLNLQKIGDLDHFYVKKGTDPLPAELQGKPPALLFNMLDGTLDVKQVFEEFFLSPFDTSAAFVVLIDAGRIEPQGAAALQAAAEPFRAAKDFARVARMLGRASKLEPQNPELLDALAAAQSAADLRKEAAKTYAALGELYRSQEKKIEAVEALHKAIELDSRNEHAYEMVMELHAGLDQFDKAEEACREASRLLSDDRDFSAALRLLDRGLGFLPESVHLRLQRATCLFALGQKVEGVKEMTAVAADLEHKGDPALTLSVYRKLLQLEPENKDYKAKVDHLLAGEKRRESRKKLVKVAGGVGVLALLALAWTLKPETESQKLARAEGTVKGTAADATREEAEKILRAIVEGIQPGADESENQSNAKRLLAELERQNAAPERQRKLAAFEKRVREDIIDPATAKMKAGKYAEGAAQLLDVAPLYKDPALKGLEGEELGGMWKRVQDGYRTALLIPADALREEWKGVKAALSEVAAVDLQKADEARQRHVYDVATRAMLARDRADWKAAVDGLTNASKNLPQLDALRVADLLQIVEQMQSAFTSLEEIGHKAHAGVLDHEMGNAYFEALKLVKDAKGTGIVARGIEACDAFLARCVELKKATPAKYFAAVVTKVFETGKWDKDIRDQRDRLKKVADGLARAKAAEERGDIQAAFDAIRETINNAQDVSFQGLARLPLQVNTRPPGATLTVSDDTGAVLATVTTPALIHYSYQGLTRLRLEAPGFDPMIVERKGIKGDKEAILLRDLQRTTRWQSTAGAAVEGQPGLAPGIVLLGTRGGLLRALSLDSGDEVFQVDTKDLSGIACGILVSGGRAFFGGVEGNAFAVDIAKRSIAWTKPTGGSVERSPAAAAGGSIVCFPVSSGGVRAFRAADGSEAWRKDLGAPLSGGILASGGLVLVPLADGRVVALAEGDGAEKWTARLATPACGTPAADGRGGFLVATEGSTIDRLPGSGGAATWSQKMDSPVHARLVVQGANLFAVSTRGALARMSVADGKIVATLPLGVGVEGDATEAGGVLYIAGTKGSLVACSLEKFEVLWVRNGLGQLQGAPAVSGEILVAASADSSGAVVGLKP